MKRTALLFEKSYAVAVNEESIPVPETREVLIKAIFSAISAGSELLVYRGQVPSRLPTDMAIKTLAKPFEYPLKYGYASVGEVVRVGSGLDQKWQGRHVFCFHPHESHYTADINDIMVLPEAVDLKEALFLPNMETAVNFLMDGRPVIGERVCVFGQGIVGLLRTALLAQFPLQQLVTFDRHAARRRVSLDVGADIALDPENPTSMDALFDADDPDETAGPADLVYELSGNPQALNQAIQVVGFSGRVVLGSWYGSQQAQLDLGGRFHRNRIQLISSQVSTLPPDLLGRWTQKRRFDMTWEMIRKCKPAQLVSHEFPLTRAKEAYELLDQNPAEALQVIFTYST